MMTSSRADQIQALAKVFVEMMPQTATVALPWATKLYDDHRVRIEVDAPPPQEFSPQVVTDAARVFLRKENPVLAARIDAAVNDEERALLLAELGATVPADLKAAEQHLGKLGDVTE